MVEACIEYDVCNRAISWKTRDPTGCVCVVYCVKYLMVHGIRDTVYLTIMYCKGLPMGLCKGDIGPYKGCVRVDFGSILGL